MRPTLTIGQDQQAYPYFLGEGLLSRAGRIVSEVAPGRMPVVVTSPPLRRLFGDRLSRSLGDGVPTLLMDDSESNKTFDTAERLVGDLLDAGARRDTVVVALGGGVVGDTAGFAASIFLRGVDLVHVPTTLLAQVDSSIGGKVAVNHPRGKNLAGSFHRPRAVIADLETLATLPPRELKSGVFEALKAGVIGDTSLFELVETSFDSLAAADRAAMDQLVRKAVAVKAAIVGSDEKEGGVRRLLNYGHTLAHGIEAALDYSGIVHGEAVAWGMIGANALAVRRGLLAGVDRIRIDEAILRCEPAPLPALDPARVMAAIEHDKKFGAGRRVMVLPRSVGAMEIVEDVAEEEIVFALAAAIETSAATQHA